MHRNEIVNALKLQATQPLLNVLPREKMSFFSRSSVMQQHIHHSTDLPPSPLIALIKYSPTRALIFLHQGHFCSFSQCHLITGNSRDDLHINDYICKYPASLGQLGAHKRASFFTDGVDELNYVLTTQAVFSYVVSYSVSQSLWKK